MATTVLQTQAPKAPSVIRTKRSIWEAVILSAILTGGLLAAQLLFTKDPVGYVETAAVYFSFGSTWLCTRQVRFNYVFGVISTVLLVWTFWEAKLYGSMILNVYLTPTVIYGWFIWKRDSAPKPVEHVKKKAMLGYGLITFLTWLGALGIITATGGKLAVLDGWILVGTVLAQYMMDRKKLENWHVWALVNIVSIYEYFQQGLYLLGSQYVFFLLNAVIAYFAWRKTLLTGGEETVGAVEPAMSSLAPKLGEAGA